MSRGRFGRRAFGAFGALLLSWIIASPLAAQCDPTTDCNANGVLDSCDVMLGTSDDCDLNGIPDECDIALDATLDCNLNGIPDLCEPISDRALSSVSGFPDSAGTSVATDGETAITGAPLAAIVGVDAGAVEVHRRVGTNWFEVTQLTTPDGGAGDLFGAAVAVDGARVAIGAPGVAGEIGAVYLYEQVAGVWTFQQRLDPPAGALGDQFGAALSLSGSTLLVGAPRGSTAAGVVPGPGRAFVYEFDGLLWNLDLELLPTDLTDGDLFGAAVDLLGDRAVVGAPDEIGTVELGSGAAYLFERAAGAWTLAARMTSPAEEAGERFGAAVAVDGDRAAIGAPVRNGGVGSILTFTGGTGTWTFDQEVVSPLLAAVGFGASLDLRGSVLLAGEGTADVDHGIAHIYDRGFTTWQLRTSSLPVGLVAGNLYGSAVSLAPETALIGAAGLPGAFAIGVAPPVDCNGNGIDDVCEIQDGLADDCDLNGIIDSCEIAAGDAADCDLDGIPDPCELDFGTETDCNQNGILDSCDFAAGAPDCNANGIPDDCETDCDGNGIPDDCDIAAGASDCDLNGLPDVCDLSFGFAEDCDGNAVPDLCQIASGVSSDCDGSGVPDACEIASGVSVDCDGDTVPDSCQLAAGAPDCNGNGTLDTCDLASGFDTDCDGNGIPDACDFAAGALDCNANGILDSCDVANGVTVDAEAPTIVGLPTTLSVSSDLGACGASVSWPAPTITDNCAIDSISATAESGDFFPVGTTLVTVTVTDLYGNVGMESFSVEVIDDEAPALSTPLIDRFANADPGTCGTTVFFTPPDAIDNCSVAQVVSTHDPGDFFPVGTTVVTVEFTDGAGNVATVFFPVTVVDTEAPTLTSVPSPITQDADAGECGAIVTFPAATADDACGVASVTMEPASGSFFPVGVTDVLVSAVDLSGNETTTTFAVEIVDPVPPELILGGFFPAPFDPGLCFAVVSVAPPLASDACGIVELTNDFTGISNASGLYPAGDTVVTWTAIDGSGNVTMASQTVSIAADPTDCDGNGVADVCDVANGFSPDCNGNGIPDECDLLSGASEDIDGNGLPDECQVQFRRGDPNGDTDIDLTDGVFILTYLFVDPNGVGCFDSLDANDNGQIQIPDAVLVLYYIFVGGIPPRPPFIECGVDATPDTLDCVQANCP